MNTAFLFSGQGSQYIGMGKELTDAYPTLMRIYNVASNILNMDLAKICFAGSEQELSRTVIAQPAIMATSLVAFEAARARRIHATAVAGHSLGEYAAMVASGMLTLEDGFRVIKARSEAMEEASYTTAGGMCAIIGKTAAEVEEICGTLSEYAVPVNYNAPTQTVIAGTTNGIEEAMEKFTEAGAKVVKLNVSAAFHCRLMESAAHRFLSEIKDVKFSTPTCKFYSNILGQELTDFEEVPNLLAQHMVSPVRFTNELTNMQAAGYNVFMECGPNKVLTGLVRKTLKGAVAVNIENVATLDKAVTVYTEMTNPRSLA